MKLNWVERMVVNNPVRIMSQRLEAIWFRKGPSPEKNARVLEFGCGRGAGARLIRKKFGAGAVVAQDLDFSMVRMGRRFLGEAERRRIFLAVGDASRMPFPDGAFDAVFSFGVLHHIPDWKSALGEVSRVLKPGGLYCIEELYPGAYRNAVTARLLEHPEEDRFESARLKRGFRDSGLRILRELEWKCAGLLAVARKTSDPPPSQTGETAATSPRP